MIDRPRGCRIDRVSRAASIAELLDRRDQFFGGENRLGIVRGIQLESGVHFVPAVAPNSIVYYAESFKDQAHLDVVLREAHAMVNRALGR